MKNLVIVHLESVCNNLLYNGSEEVFPNLSQIAEKCCVFTNYYSTASSTIMAVGDLMYGDPYQLEKCRNLDSVYKQRTMRSTFELLEEKGYQTSAYIYPHLPNKMDRLNLKKLFGHAAHYEDCAEQDQFHKLIKDAIKSERKFAIYVYNNTSLLSSPFRAENVGHDFLETVEESYRNIDQTADFIFQTLQSEHVLEDTVVLLFGDHGDDLFSHGLTHGFTHAIEPYASVIRTPLMIYSSQIQQSNITDLVNTLDIRNMILPLLEDKTVAKDTWYPKRNFSFSRNLFWNQKSSILNKAYSVTDGRYMLMVSPEGLELYLCKYDVFGTVNLLNFFDLYDKTIRLKKEIKYIEGIHIEYMLKKPAGPMTREFTKLREELLNHLEQMQIRTGIKLDFKPWFQRIRKNDQIQKELKHTAAHSIIDQRIRGIIQCVTRFVS